MAAQISLIRTYHEYELGIRRQRPHPLGSIRQTRCHWTGIKAHPLHVNVSIWAICVYGSIARTA